MASYGRPSPFNISDSDIEVLKSLKTAEDIRLYISRTDGRSISEIEKPYRILSGIITKILNV